MRPRQVELRIGELVLEGVGGYDRDRMVASLERELAQRLSRGERPQRSRDAIVAERPGGELSPADLGAHVARTITKGGER